MASATQLPKTMKGVWIEKTGGTEVLQYKTDIPVPELKEGEVLVKNEYIGINYIDTYFRTGLYPPPNFPYILGREGAGTIAALGPKTPSHLSLNASVVYMNQSAYAEFTPVPATAVVALPPSISPETAAAASLQGLTALTLIRDAYAVQRGDWILVHAAAGGVGLWLVQLLKAVGARTIATASTEEKRALAAKYGAEVTLEYFDYGDVFVKKVLEVTGGKGVSAVFDGVGKATFDASLNSLARKGSLVSFGNASGAVPPVTISRLTAKNAKLLRPTFFNYISEEGELEKYSAELWDFIVKDKMDVRIHEIYPLEDVARAHQDIESRKSTGKLLLRP
ncbi:NAD(P)-binding protein [Lophium mytilinum]|uniref:Probable quinone oxidoreductase n=1 Tax=Lophium mytilinum TaxID=390894 RepID=A0A6A6QIF0_9PEZI|nr:NAD(P)-binding protein [Lophium mytilinum]